MTAATAGALERPPLKLTIKNDDGEEQTIKMSYGLFQDLQRLVPDAGAIVDTIAADPNTRDYMVRRCLTDSKKIITDWDLLIQAEDINVSDPDVINEILQWITGHLLYFFGISAGGLKQLTKLLVERLEDQPAPSIAGSQS